MDKRKKRSLILQYAFLVLLAAAILVLLLYMIPYRFHLNKIITFKPDVTFIDNPLMGFAPDAREEAQCENSRMVFINLTWAEWEPEENVFAVDVLEEKYHLARWKRENKHAVLRFVCDVPGKKDHMDIPDWLYRKTGDGQYYDTKYGKGYSPDYGNEAFMAAHENALRRLGEYCGDGFVSFVELGSLGHWGEWHATGNEGESLMPDPTVCETYASQYLQCFHGPKLLTRRSYSFAAASGMGSYNDMVGAREDTETWLGWLENGGSQMTSTEPLALVPLPSPGMLRPIGGEFTSSIPMEEIFGASFGDTLADITASRMTFLGPKVPDLTDKDREVERNSILRRMGYRIYVSKLETRYDFTDHTIRLEFTWKNVGNAGFFFDWPATVYIYDGNRELVFSEILDLDLRDLNGAEEVLTAIKVPYAEELRDEFYVGVQVRSNTGAEQLILAIDDENAETIGDSQILYHYSRR
jgi:hypothetical protein